MFTAACAAKSVLVVATANDEGHVEIARAEPGPGAAAEVVPWAIVKAVEVVPWAIVKAVAPGIFGPAGEQIALDFMMNHGYHLKMLNKHISGFSQGVQAHAAAN
eukprot:jgi/Chrpa1/15525/Chrysochromulina_OHIO_Genome00019631-RA